MGNQLKSCPFCGGGAGIGICDDEGNKRTLEYEENPSSGIGYYLMHDIKTGVDDDCPIALDIGEIIGNWVYDTREEAIDAWNSRKTNQVNSTQEAEKYGYWEIFQESVHGNAWFCSVCHIGVRRQSNYCPSCGANMRSLQ